MSMRSGSPKMSIEEALTKVPGKDLEEAEFALRTPDLYPARNVADYLGVNVPAVHSWRRERGIKKATC